MKSTVLKLCLALSLVLSFVDASPRRRGGGGDRGRRGEEMDAKITDCISDDDNAEAAIECVLAGDDCPNNDEQEGDGEFDRYVLKITRQYSI